MAMTVWYVPGWLRTQAPQPDVCDEAASIFPEAKVVFKEWDGDQLLWPKAVANADAAVDGFVREIAALPQAEREELVLVGHSLGGRIVARILARLDERSLKVRQAVLMGAAIPYADKDVRWIGNGARLPVLVICNPDDVTLKYVYATVGGEKSAALGANGALQRLVNVQEYVVPASVTKETAIGALWAELPVARDLANHYAVFYFACLRKIVADEPVEGRVMVPQDLVTLPFPVVDAGIWWETVETSDGWKLERNKVTGHARIVDPQKVRRAWGGLAEMKRSFAKVKRQL